MEEFLLYAAATSIRGVYLDSENDAMQPLTMDVAPLNMAFLACKLFKLSYIFFRYASLLFGSKFLGSRKSMIVSSFLVIASNSPSNLISGF